MMKNYLHTLMTNCIDLVDLLGISFIFFIGLRLYLLYWYAQFLVSLYIIYQLYKEGYKQLISEMYHFTEFFKITNILLKIFKYVKIGFGMIKKFSFVGIFKTMSDYFLQEIKNWIKSTIINKISDIVVPFIKTKVIDWIYKKFIEFVKKTIKDNKSKIIKTICIISAVILVYFISWLYWPIRQIINVSFTVALLFSLYYFREIVSTYISYYNNFLANFYYDKMISNNKLIQMLFFNLLTTQTFFKCIVENVHEERKLYENKSIVIQTNMIMVGIFPILLVFRYITSNALWFFGFTIVSSVIYAIFFVKQQFYFRIVMKIREIIIEFVDFIDSVKEVADEIKIKVCKIVGKVAKNVAEFFQSLGEISSYVEHLRNHEKNKDEDEKEKEDKKEEEKEKEKEKQEKLEKEINEEIDKIESSALRKIVFSFMAKYKIKICFAILLYTCFQNFLIAYIFAFCYSIFIFIFYAAYQLLIEKISKQKFNYYSLMWMFYFLNKQILLFPIWLKFFAYHQHQQYMVQSHHYLVHRHH